MINVLISDRELELYHLLEKALQKDYKISILEEDNELLEGVLHNPVDLILLTISSADLGGFRTLDIVRRIPKTKSIPVIFLAKQKDLELEEKALSLGVDDFLTFPISEELLKHRINTCLELYNLRKERPYVEKYQDAISFSFAELVECRDESTGGHLKNTTTYFNILLQEAMNSDQYKAAILPDDVRDLLRSAMLHDIGKLGITDDILRKESPLDYSEFEHMKTHTTLGKLAFDKIIEETGGTRWLYLARDIAYCHHERWDGSGYPNGLRGEEIPLYARMLTIADVYDALTSVRAYKKEFTHEKATQIIIEGKGTYFDPSLVDLFIKVNKKFEEMLRRNKMVDTIERK